jgi:methyl-accepting chemotaxis protein
MKWTVGRKISAGFVLALLTLLIIGIVALRNTRALIDTARSVDHTHEMLYRLEHILSSSKDVQSGERGYVITGLEDYLEPYNEAVSRLDDEVKQTRKLTADDFEQRRRLDLVEPLITEIVALASQTIGLRKSAGFEAAQHEMLTDQSKKLVDDLRQRIREMQAVERASLAERSEAAGRAAKGTMGVIIIGTFIVFMVLLAGSFWIVRDIAGPLAEITRVAERIARGQLGVDFSSDGRTDEVGMLAQAFQRMSRSLKVLAGRASQIAGGDLTVRVKPQSEDDVLGNAFLTMSESLRSIITEFVEAVNVLASAASEIMASTAQLASSAAETATAVTETTATVEEVKQTSQLSSQKARTVSDEAQSAAEVAQSGKRSVDETIHGMNDIRQQMSAIAESILRLSAQSREIGEIIATVDDLAAQSKLLAVNASIEAAKAGEEGKGFSVVAQEVKSLAELSKQATTQVRGILNEIQKATSKAVLATEHGNQAVESGVRQSAAAGASIGALAESISEAAQAATQIAATSQQQFVGMDQVALAMESIKGAATQTVASTKQAETAAQQLHDLGQRLKQLVERFKV